MCLLLDTVVHVPTVLIAAKGDDEFDVMLCGSQVASPAHSESYANTTRSKQARRNIIGKTLQ